MLTKAGCNSGPCHGAAAGKNGFKLTLRGYDEPRGRQFYADVLQRVAAVPGDRVRVAVTGAGPRGFRHGLTDPLPSLEAVESATAQARDSPYLLRPWRRSRCVTSSSVQRRIL